MQVAYSKRGGKRTRRGKNVRTRRIPIQFRL